MKFNSKVRRNLSANLLEKKATLDDNYNSYFNRINNVASKVCSSDQEDVSSRNTLISNIKSYTDNFNEIKFLDRYIFNSNDAVDFLKTRTVDVRRYIPHWSDFSSSIYLEDGITPMVFEDCNIHWAPFIEGKSGRSKDVHAKSKLYKGTDLVSDEELKLPSESDFTSLIKYSEEYTSPIGSANGVTVNQTVMDGCYSVKCIVERLLKETEYPKELVDNMKIIPVISSPVPSSNTGSGTGPNPATKISRNKYSFKISNIKMEKMVEFNNKWLYPGSSLFFGSGSNDYYGLAHVIEAKIVKKRNGLSPSYSGIYSCPDIKTRDAVIATYMNDDRYWNIEEYLGVTIEFSDLPKEAALTLTNSENVSQATITNYLNKEITELKNGIYCARYNYLNSYESSRITDGNPEKNYNDFYNYLNNYNTSTLTTICNTIINWIKQRVEILSASFEDETPAKTIVDITKERMDKSTGTLYGWYSQEVVPLGGAYDDYEKKLKNNLSIFKSILVMKNAELDYTLEDNGGALNNPNFIDIPYDNYSYYRNAGNNQTFKVGDTVYIEDDTNAELETKITSIKVWDAVSDIEDDGNGGAKKVYMKCRRLYLANSLMNNYDYTSLRVIKLIV